MRYDTKIPDLTLVYGCHNILPHNLFYLPFCLIAFLPAPSRQLCHSFPAPKRREWDARKRRHRKQYIKSPKRCLLFKA
jgi:hypothetical protein